MTYTPPTHLDDMPCVKCPDFRSVTKVFDHPHQCMFYCCNDRAVSFGDITHEHVKEVIIGLLRDCPKRRIMVLREHLRKTTFYVDPASANWHGNHRGGLEEHSINVMNNLYDLTRKHNLKWMDRDSIEIISLAHDMCKIGAYIPDGSGGYGYAYPKDRGHGDVSLELAREVIPLTEEEELCIRWHMGPYDVKENWPLFDDAVKRFPNVFWTFVADWTAAKFNERKSEASV